VTDSGKTNGFPAPSDEKDPVRRDIRAAMNRLRGGATKNVPAGSPLTVVNLAQEAGVKRHALTHWHPDLKDEFYARRDAAVAETTSDRERMLEACVAKAEAEIAALRRESDNWHNAAKDFVRIIQTLELEANAYKANIETLKARLEAADMPSRVTHLR